MRSRLAVTPRDGLRPPDAYGLISPDRYRLRALARLSLPELVRGRVRGGTSSITQFMPVIERTLSRISSRRRDALGLVRGAALDEHRGRFLAARRGDREGGDVARLKPGNCSTAHSISCGQWFLPLMMIMSLARPTM